MMPLARGRENAVSGCLLHRALARRHEHEVILVVLFDRQQGVDLLALAQRQQIDHGAAARAAPGERDFVDLQPVDLALVGETQHGVVGVGDEQLLDEILVLHGGGRLAAAAAPLSLIFRERLRFRISRVGQRDDHILWLDQVFGREIQVIAVDLGPAGIAVGLADHDELIAHDLGETLRARQDVAEVPDPLEQLLVLVDDLVLLQPGEAMQAHVEDGLGLVLGQMIAAAIQPEIGREAIGARGNRTRTLQQLRNDASRPRPCEQARTRLSRRRRSLDQRDDVVDIRQRNGQVPRGYARARALWRDRKSCVG